MNIIDFCNINKIKWFPIIIDSKKIPVPIKHECYKRINKSGNISHVPHYIEFNDIDNDILLQRQNLFFNNQLNQFIQNTNHTIKIAIDTSKVFQIDIDTPLINKNTLFNWINNNDTKSAFFKSITKPYGYHIFIILDEFHQQVKEYTATINRFQFKDTYISNEGCIVEIFNKSKDYGNVELLTGQWSYAFADTIVHNNNITTIREIYVSFWTDLLQINKNKNENKIENNSDNNDINNDNNNNNNNNSKYRYDNQEIYDHMINVNQSYIDDRNTHFKIVCSLLNGGYRNIAKDCMFRSSNTKNKNLENEFLSFENSNNKSISIKSLFYYSKESNKNNYFSLLKKYRGLFLREEYKATLLSLNYITESINERYIPYNIIGNTDTTINTITHIKSHLGSGKTTIIKKFIKTNPNIKKVLYFAPRILFAQDIYNDLKPYGFKLYNKLSKKEYQTTDRFIIQLESLWKIPKQSFDLIIIDEIESVLKQLTSKITNKNIVETYKNFQYLLENCKTIITADAFLSNNSVETISRIKRNSIIKTIENRYNPYKRTAIEVTGFSNLLEKAKCQLENNERIVFITMIKSNGDEAYDYFKTEFPNKTIKYYYGTMSESDKNFDNINEEWKNVDILIYTPIITCGVNYSFRSFHSLYLWISPNSCCVRDLFQASLRVRELINNECFFAFNYTFNRFSRKCDIVSKIFENSEGNMLNIYKNLFEKQEFLIELGVAIPKLCDWGIHNLSYFIFEDYVSNNNIVQNTHEYLRLCGYDIIPLETLPTFDEVEDNTGSANIPLYSDILDIDEYEAKSLEANVYTLEEIEKFKLMKYKFDIILNSNQLVSENNENNIIINNNLNEIFHFYHNKIDMLRNLVYEIKNMNNIDHKTEINKINENCQNNYDVYVNTNFIETGVNKKLMQTFNSDNIMNLSYNIDDIMNNMDTIGDIITKAQVIYNFRKPRGTEKKKNFKYINACIKHIMIKSLGVDIEGKRKRVNKKRTYEYKVKLNEKQELLVDVLNKIQEKDNLDKEKEEKDDKEYEEFLKNKHGFKD